MSLHTLLANLRVAIRSLAREPRYAVVVVITLALGIAADTVIFSVMNPYLVRQLPFREPERLMQLGHVDADSGWDMARFAHIQVEDLRRQSQGIEAMGSYYYSKRNLVDTEGAQQIMAGYLSGNLLDVLGVAPLRGRGFASEDEGTGGNRVVLISNKLWKIRYGERADIIGSVITISSRPYEVIGVMPPDFDFPFGEVRLWMPVPVDPDPTTRDSGSHLIIARLKQGWSREQVEAELNGIHSSLAQQYPDADGQYSGISVVPLRKALNFAYEILQYSFLALLTAVTLLLLLACVNVASLTLARATARSREVAIRAAVGARRSQLVGQLLIEGVLLAAAACLLGIGLSALALRAVSPVLPAEALFKSGEFTIDLAVLAYAVGISLLTPLVFSLVPALRATRQDLYSGLRAGHQGSGKAIHSRRALVVCETAIAIVLVSGAALAAQALLDAHETDVGFRAEQVLAVEITLPSSEYDSEEAIHQAYSSIEGRLAAIAGVGEVGRISQLPLNHETSHTGFALPGQVPASSDQLPNAITTGVSDSYFTAMGIPLVSGRYFNEIDLENRQETVVISRSIAERSWPGRSPVGETLMIGRLDELRPVTVVGVVGNVKTEGLESPQEGHIYVPIGSQNRQFLVLATEAPAGMISTVRGELRELLPTVPAVIRPMVDVVRESMLQWSITSLFFGIFGTIAVMLTTLGIYGVVSYSVARRTRELGIRLAIGATSQRLSRMVLGEGLKLTSYGIGIGLLVSIVLTQLIGSVASGIEPQSVISFLLVICLFVVISVVASLGPALRASRCDPQAVLRHE
jgi:predicted permease